MFDPQRGRHSVGRLASPSPTARLLSVGEASSALDREIAPKPPNAEHAVHRDLRHRGDWQAEGQLRARATQPEGRLGASFRPAAGTAATTGRSLSR